MVKRLRRRPLTAKTGVRVPVGLPKKQTGKSLSVFLVASFAGTELPPACGRLFARAKRRSAEGTPGGGVGRYPVGLTDRAERAPFLVAPFVGTELPPASGRLFARAKRRSAEGTPGGDCFLFLVFPPQKKERGPRPALSCRKVFAAGRFTPFGRPCPAPANRRTSGSRS